MNLVASSQPWKRNCNPALSPRVLFSSFLLCRLSSRNYTQLTSVSKKSLICLLKASSLCSNDKCKLIIIIFLIVLLVCCWNWIFCLSLSYSMRSSVGASMLVRCNVKGIWSTAVQCIIVWDQTQRNLSDLLAALCHPMTWQWKSQEFKEFVFS